MIHHGAHSSNPACIILSGGSSQRMGSPKALLKFRQNTFIQQLILDYTDIGCTPILLVVGKHAREIRRNTSRFDVTVLDNPHPEGGPISSLKIAVSVLSRDCPGFFLALVDHPAVQVRTLHGLLSIWNGRTDRVVRPRYRGRGGHPVLVGREWIEKILALPEEETMRDLLRSQAENVVDMDCDDQGIIKNIDTPEDYQTLIGSYDD